MAKGHLSDVDPPEDDSGADAAGLAGESFVQQSHDAAPVDRGGARVRVVMMMMEREEERVWCVCQDEDHMGIF